MNAPWDDSMQIDIISMIFCGTVAESTDGLNNIVPVC